MLQHYSSAFNNPAVGLDCSDDVWICEQLACALILFGTWTLLLKILPTYRQLAEQSSRGLDEPVHDGHAGIEILRSRFEHAAPIADDKSSSLVTVHISTRHLEQPANVDIEPLKKYVFWVKDTSVPDAFDENEACIDITKGGVLPEYMALVQNTSATPTPSGFVTWFKDWKGLICTSGAKMHRDPQLFTSNGAMRTAGNIKVSDTWRDLTSPDLTVLHEAWNTILLEDSLGGKVPDGDLLLGYFKYDRCSDSVLCEQYRIYSTIFDRNEAQRVYVLPLCLEGGRSVEHSHLAYNNVDSYVFFVLSIFLSLKGPTIRDGKGISTAEFDNYENVTKLREDARILRR